MRRTTMHGVALASFVFAHHMMFMKGAEVAENMNITERRLMMNAAGPLPYFMGGPPKSEVNDTISYN